ncbi:MAG: prenyltransferase [Chloroflexi bacterium]|nr:prenyltransferase [Chloroflexota bacterium]
MGQGPAKAPPQETQPDSTKQKSSLVSFLRLSNPGLLAAGGLFYTIGAAVADYLGLRVSPTLLILGLLVMGATLLLAQYLNAYFTFLVERRASAPDPSAAYGLPRNVALYAAIISGGILAILLTGMAVQRAAPLASWLMLGIGILLTFAYSVPPLRLATSGYGELTAAIGLAGLAPAYGFALQTGEAHRLVWLATAPLIALMFAMLITLRLRDYAGDLQHERRTLIVRLGWEAGMRLHDGAILLAAGLMAAGLAGGLPSRVGIGGAIVLPLAAAQIWQMRRIRSGFPPRWHVLVSVAAALLTLTAYFILVGFLLS